MSDWSRGSGGPALTTVHLEDARDRCSEQPVGRADQGLKPRASPEDGGKRRPVFGGVSALNTHSIYWLSLGS